MKKAIKTAGKVAIGAGLAYLAMGEVVYEAVVNPRVMNLIVSSPFYDDSARDDFLEGCAVYHEDNDWFDEHYIADTIIYSDRMSRDSYAKVYFQDEPTDKYAVVVHGYNDTPKGMTRWIRAYLEMGFNVVVPYLIGHGPDKNLYCSMGYYDRYIVMDWIDYINSLNDKAKIVIHGVSMGGATTLMVTGEEIPENVVAAVGDCSYTSCWDEYCSQLENFPVPASAIVAPVNLVSKIRGNFDFKEASPLKAVIRSKTPTLFIHGDGDTFVPYSMMEPLYEACGAADKQMLTVHCNVHALSAYADGELYWNTVKEFISKYL